MNNKGGVINLVILAIMSVFFILLFYIVLQLYNPITELLFPVLVNVPNGSIIQLAIEWVPAIIITLFIMTLIMVGTKSKDSGYAG